METRNFYILVVSVLIGLATFWLIMIASLEFDPFDDPNKIEELVKEINEELNVIDRLYKRKSLSKEEWTRKKELLNMKKVTLLRKLDTLE